MKVFRLLVTLLLVALCAEFCSCEKEEESQVELTVESTSTLFKEYGIDPTNYTHISALYSLNTFIAAGLKNGFLWVAAYDTISHKQLKEFIDNEPTPETATKNLGYGENKILPLEQTTITGFILTDNGYIGQSAIIYTDRTYELIKLITFFSNGKSVKTIIDSRNKLTNLKKWYKNSVISSDSICYNDKGDTLFIAKYPIKETEIPITYTDGINIDFISQRINHSTGEPIWTSKLTPPFEIPSNAKKEITIIEKDNAFWKCKVNILFYDGTKKNFTFEININDGTIQILS